MSWEAAKKKFLEEVRLRSYDDKFIDRKEEREVLQIGLVHDLDVVSARDLLIEYCQSSKSVLVSQVREQIKDHLDVRCAERGWIDEAGFFEIVEKCGEWSRGKIKDQEGRRLVLEVLEFHGYALGQGLLANWVEEVRRG